MTTNGAIFVLGICAFAQGFVVLSLFLSEWKLRRRVTMLEDSVALHGQVMPYGARGRTPGARQ